MKFLNDYQRYLKEDKRHSPQTIRSYMVTACQFGHGLNEKDIKEASTEDVETFIRRFNPSTAQTKLAGLHEFFVWLVKQKIVPFNPVDQVQRPKVPERVHVWLEPSELNEVRDNIDDSWTGIRDCAIIELMYATGLRNEPVRNILVDDLDLEDKTIRVISKGNRESIEPLNHNAVFALKKWLDIRNGNLDPHLFLRKSGKWLKHGEELRRIIRKRAGFLDKKVSPHTFRHTHIQHIYDQTGDLEQARKSARHKNINTTQRYAQARDLQVKNARDLLQ